MTNDRVVREDECFALSGLCNMQRRRLEKRGEFPRRFKLNPNSGATGAVGWSLSELQAWLDVRKQDRAA